MTFKIIIYGDKKSGKTSYINRLLYNSFSYKYLSTINPSIININYLFKNINSLEELKLNINLLECPENSILKDICYIDANAIILIYDITNKKSFDNLYNNYKNIKNINNNIPILLLGNKNDSLKEHYTYHNLTDSYFLHNIKFFTISCKNNKNIHNSFNYILSKLIN